MAIFGITASSYDSLSFKTAKYSIKNYIPIVGGYLSDGLNIILLSSSIIKNALGVASLICVLFIILKPIFTIIAIKLMLSLLSAVLENSAEKKIITFFSNTNKSLNMLIALICSVAMMFIIFMSLCIMTTNYIL